MALKHILIVDDEKDLLEVLKETLELEGFQVSSFERADDALKYLNKADVPVIDLIVSDMRMPDKNGLELALMVNKELRLKIPFMMISGFADITPQQIQDAQITEFITKPFSLDSFIDRINDLLK
ncbi:MAG: response regulator [Pseudobdellovibrio sp.]